MYLPLFLIFCKYRKKSLTNLSNWSNGQYTDKVGIFLYIYTFINHLVCYIKSIFWSKQTSFSVFENLLGKWPRFNHTSGFSQFSLETWLRPQHSWELQETEDNFIEIGYHFRIKLRYCWTIAVSLFSMHAYTSSRYQGLSRLVVCFCISHFTALSPNPFSSAVSFGQFNHFIHISN